MNGSVAVGHYPQMVWRQGQRRLWNPIQKKAFKNLPEERLRLQLVEYLLHGGWSKHRISMEEAIRRDGDEHPLRCDIICYSKAFEPILLVECKAEAVNLSEKTAAQITRYNHQVQAPYLLISNGRSDLWYHLQGHDPAQPLNTIPEIINAQPAPPVSIAYLKKRGFLGNKAGHALREWAGPIGEMLFTSPRGAVRYLSFKKALSDLELSHYYRVVAFGDDRLALGLLATAYGGTRLVAILNRGGENVAVLETNLDLAFKNEVPNTSIYHAGETPSFDGRALLSKLRPKTAIETMAQVLGSRIEEEISR